MTHSEEYIAKLCNSSFMAFWSFASPIGKKGKELCDVLVVCDPYIVIISIKDINMKLAEESSINYDRWLKKAILKSSDQIYGAERYIRNGGEVRCSVHGNKINIPELSRIVILRIAVAFGSNAKFPLVYGDMGKGFVHTFDEKASDVLFRELDTVSDFTKYLIAKERLLRNKTNLFSCHETDFLAFYFNHGFNHPGVDSYIIDSNLWESYVQSEEYCNYQNRMQDSYIWDAMISKFTKNLENGSFSTQKQFNEIEMALRILNKEDRTDRSYFSDQLKEVYQKGLRSRIAPSYKDSNYKYVFMPIKNEAIKDKQLQLLCEVARFIKPEKPIVIGIGYRFESDGGFFFDLMYSELHDYSHDYRKRVERLRSEKGYFKNY